MVDKDKNPQPVSLKVFIPEHLRAGSYANVVSVTTTSNGEIMLDFVFNHPQDYSQGEKQATLVSRVVLPEQVARQLLNILMGNLGTVQKE
jgi:hypothetical protein